MKGTGESEARRTRSLAAYQAHVARRATSAAVEAIAANGGAVRMGTRAGPGRLSSGALVRLLKLGVVEKRGRYYCLPDAPTPEDAFRDCCVCGERFAPPIDAARACSKPACRAESTRRGVGQSNRKQKERRRSRSGTSGAIAIPSRSDERAAVLAEIRAEEPWQPGVDYQRPRTRGECEPGGALHMRPCPFVSCRHHLYLDVTEAGSIVLPEGNVEPGDLLGPLMASCSLDLADDGALTLAGTSVLLGVSKQRIDQIEAQARARLRLPLLPHRPERGVERPDLHSVDDDAG